jgi:hypothetical protein
MVCSPCRLSCLPSPCGRGRPLSARLTRFRCSAGPLYQVRRASDNTTLDVKVTGPGGFADSAAQDKFCGTSACHIWRIYDQSPKMNHLDIAPPGGAHRAEDAPVNATKLPLTVGGHKVYGAHFEGGMGCESDCRRLLSSDVTGVF